MGVGCAKYSAFSSLKCKCFRIKKKKKKKCKCFWVHLSSNRIGIKKKFIPDLVCAWLCLEVGFGKRHSQSVHHVGKSKFLWILRHPWLCPLSNSSVTPKITTLFTTHTCVELWLVEGCPHIYRPSSPHQPQLTTWASCGQSCGFGYGTRFFLIHSLLLQLH